jgi:predicted protein tyrosine phosphatase
MLEPLQEGFTGRYFPPPLRLISQELSICIQALLSCSHTPSGPTHTFILSGEIVWFVGKREELALTQNPTFVITCCSFRVLFFLSFYLLGVSFTQKLSVFSETVDFRGTVNAPHVCEPHPRPGPLRPQLRGELPRDYQWPLSGQLHVALSGTWKTTQHPAAIIIVLLTRKEYDSLSEQLRSRWGVQLGDGAHGREHYFQLDDAPTATEFPATLRACVALLQQMHQHDKRPCLVHCYAGVSRSASVVIAYLMTRYALKAQDAYALVEQRRPCINPNPYFERELFAYERELFPPPPQ